MLVLASGCRGGTAVEAVNVGAQPSGPLAAEVTGRTYPLSLLRPGRPATARVTPASESGISIVDASARDTLGSRCYTGRGYGGAVRFEVRGDTAAAVARGSSGWAP